MSDISPKKEKKETEANRRQPLSSNVVEDVLLIIVFRNMYLIDIQVLRVFCVVVTFQTLYFVTGEE